MQRVSVTIASFLLALVARCNKVSIEVLYDSSSTKTIDNKQNWHFKFTLTYAPDSAQTSGASYVVGESLDRQKKPLKAGLRNDNLELRFFQLDGAGDRKFFEKEALVVRLVSEGGSQSFKYALEFPGFVAVHFVVDKMCFDSASKQTRLEIQVYGFPHDARQGGNEFHAGFIWNVVEQATPADRYVDLIFFSTKANEVVFFEKHAVGQQKEIPTFVVGRFKGAFCMTTNAAQIQSHSTNFGVDSEAGSQTCFAGTPRTLKPADLLKTDLTELYNEYTRKAGSSENLEHHFIVFSGFKQISGAAVHALGGEFCHAKFEKLDQKYGVMLTVDAYDDKRVLKPLRIRV